MAPTHELLHGLTEVTKYLRDDPRRLALAERAGTSEVSHKLFMRLYCARHPSRMAHYSTEMQDSCPLSGRNLAFMRLVRHVTGRGGRRSRQQWSHRSTAPHSLIASWQPADWAEVTGPGTAISGRPWSCAWRAVFSAPLRSAASTTTVPRLSAAITRLRTRNPGLVGIRPGGHSLTSAPISVILRKSPSWACG